jgi:uncharacterized glyoxalase superfamily protein PhnB
MKLKYTILYVENVPETLAFYHAAFGVKQRMLHESGGYGELNTGQTTLAFASFEQLAALGKTPVAPTPGRPSFEIAFETDDVPAAFEQAVAAGATAVMQPDQMPWGQMISYVTDKNGFLVEICSPVEPD